jgi:hypothetical protein
MSRYWRRNRPETTARTSGIELALRTLVGRSARRAEPSVRHSACRIFACHRTCSAADPDGAAGRSKRHTEAGSALLGDGHPAGPVAQVAQRGSEPLHRPAVRIQHTLRPRHIRSPLPRDSRVSSSFARGMLRPGRAASRCAAVNRAPSASGGRGRDGSRRRTAERALATGEPPRRFADAGSALSKYGGVRRRRIWLTGR